MRVTTIETSGLGDRSYVIDDGHHAVVVDPQRDIDRVLDHLRERGLQLGMVCETHIHNDYVTGGLALARATGADYAVNAVEDVAYRRRPVHPDETITVGELEVRVSSTPGHTPHHLAYVISDGQQTGVFTGGSMLYGTVGRTDLIGPDMTDQLTREQYRSVRGLAADLDPATEVFPTHGFGSFCASAGGGSRTEGTIADEREENIAVLADDEDEFVQTLTSGFSAHPPYYGHMGLLNRAGPLAPDLSLPPRASAADLRARVDRGEWVVDVRPNKAFASAHLPGSISVDLDGSLATYLGWAVPWGTTISLVGDDEEQIGRAGRELARIGLDQPQAMSIGGPEEYAGDDAASYPARTFSDLASDPSATVVDVRRDDEWDEGHLADAIHVRMEDLADQADDLPDQTLWIHCASGYRASIAASIIARAGRDVIWIDDDWDNAEDASRPIVS